MQCPKLRVHPAPGVHIFSAGCTIFGGVHPACARFLRYVLILYIGRVHGSISGCTVLGDVHPVSAQNKSLISDTDMAFIILKLYQRVYNIHSEGTVSQNLKTGLSVLYLCQKTGRFLLYFHIYFSRFH